VCCDPVLQEYNVYLRVQRKGAPLKLFQKMLLILFMGLPVWAQDSRPKGLEPYIGKALDNLEAVGVNEFHKQLEAMTGDKPPDEKNWRAYEPRWVKPFGTGNVAYTLLEAYPGYDVPDVSSIQIHVFDKNWKRLAKQSFPTGYRFFLNDVFTSKDNPLKEELLVAKVTSSGPFLVRGNEKRPAFEQGDYQFQYYALLGEHFSLIRLEDDKKDIAQNSYASRVPFKGPVVPKRTRDEWIGSLRSKKTAEQLATLVWLSGMHLPSTEARQKNVNQESVEDSKLFEAVRDAVETKKILQELTSSTNSWVQEYAKFTLQMNSE
jgi:hypothetical protein